MFCRWAKQLYVIIFLSALILSVPLVCQGEQRDKPPGKIKLLIVDETKTIQSSMKVQVVARAIKNTGLFDISAHIVNVDSSFETPLGKNLTDKTFDIIMLFPRGLDDGSIKQVWILSPPIKRTTGPSIKNAISVLSEIAENIFQVKALDVTEDLIPAFWASFFQQQGWLTS